MATSPLEALPDPRFDLLSLARLRESAAVVLAFKPEARTIRAAHAECVEEMRRRGLALDFYCKGCHALLDEKMESCWACGAEIRDGLEEPEMDDSELRRRAATLGVATEGRESEAVLRDLDRAETARATKVRDARLQELESARLNETLTAEMPDGWRKNRAQMYTSYWDPAGVRRIGVCDRGLSVLFNVDDGALDGVPNLKFYPKAERVRKHMGRSNYVFVGDVAKDALEVCRGLFKRFSATKASRTPKSVRPRTRGAAK